MKEFKTDECSVISAIWKFITKKKLPFYMHCIEHDKAYWQGGTKKERYFGK